MVVVVVVVVEGRKRGHGGLFSVAIALSYHITALQTQS
jgi:hypothetical protein